MFCAAPGSVCMARKEKQKGKVNAHDALIPPGPTSPPPVLVLPPAVQGPAETISMRGNVHFPETASPPQSTAVTFASELHGDTWQEHGVSD